MPVTKQQLKLIVKECLLEILSEGISNSTGNIVESKKKDILKLNSSPHPSTIIRQNANNVRVQSTALKEAIKREAGGNDIMASILADTAEKTLPTMLENDRSKIMPPGGAAERVVASHDPQELFGEEAASKWANLAFMGISKK
jgi:hypothetical protein